MSTTKRIVIIDALRGFAMLGIVIMSCVGHFNISEEANLHFFFSDDIDNQIMQFIFFFFNGKALSIFALLFGFSFNILAHRNNKTGIDFRLRLIWRLAILLCIGFIHSLIFKGDALQLFAILGLFLILVFRLSSKTLTYIAILLASQIPIIINIVASFVKKDFQYIQLFDESLWSEADKVYSHGSFIDVLAFNLWKGRIMTWGLIFYTGQYLQILALFNSGIILSRVKFFDEIEKHSALFFKILIMAILLILLFGFINKSIMISEFSDVQKLLISTLIRSWSNLAFTVILMLGFILLFLRYKNMKVFKLLAAYGQMSLSSYILLSIFGTVFFYGFGFGMFKFMSIGWSLVFAVLVVYMQMNFSNIWLKNFNYGPLEWLWRAITYIDFKIKFRKDKETGFAASV